MKHKTRGIALHRINYSDSSLIVQVLTRDYGVRSYIIKGASSKRSSAKKAIFLPLNQLELEVSNSGKERMEMIYEARNYPVNPDIHTNVYKSCIAQFAAELLLKSLRQQDLDPQLFDYIEANIQWLEEAQGDFGSFHLVFALGMTKFLGFYPSEPVSGHNYFDLVDGTFNSRPSMINPCADPSESMLLKNLMEHGRSFKADRKNRNMLLHLLVKYYSLHIPSFSEIKSLKVLEEVLA